MEIELTQEDIGQLVMENVRRIVPEMGRKKQEEINAPK